MFITNMRIIQEGVSWTVPLPKGTLPAECWQANSIEPHNKNGKIMKNRKWNNKAKGFTLVEVIVVLVILAILAAILVPTMIGWIKKANEKTAIAEARNILIATQTIASEAAGDPSSMIKGSTFIIDDDRQYLRPIKTEILELAELSDKRDMVGVIMLKDYKVDNFTYKTEDVTITYHAQAGGSGQNTYEAGFTVTPN